MFLWTVNEGPSNRVVQERFSHSGETISRCFHEVLEALLLLHKETVILPVTDTPVGSRITDDPKYGPYFQTVLEHLTALILQCIYQQLIKGDIGTVKAGYPRTYLLYVTLIWSLHIYLEVGRALHMIQLYYGVL
jgi:hypothetical protein